MVDSPVASSPHTNTPTPSPEGVSSASKASFALASPLGSHSDGSPQQHPKLRPLAPAPPVPQPMAPPQRMSSTTATTPSGLSTSSSSSSTRTRPIASPRTTLISIAEYGDEEDWEDMPAIAIKDMDHMTAQHQLFKANTVIRRLRAALARSKMIASQFHLQTRLLKIETEESLRRHQVENSIVKREVDRLRMDLVGTKQHLDGGMDSDGGGEEAEKYRRRLMRAKSRLAEAHRKLEEREIEVEKLKQRLREGRPHHRPSTGRAAGRHKHRGSHDNEDGGLAALGILASQVLSQQQLDDTTESNRVAAAAADLPRADVASAVPKRVGNSALVDSDTDVVDTDVEVEEDSRFEDAPEFVLPDSPKRIKPEPSRPDMNGLQSFDPDATIELESSPAVVGFHSINMTPVRKSALPIEIPRGIKRRRRSSASTVSVDDI